MVMRRRVLVLVVCLAGCAGNTNPPLRSAAPDSSATESSSESRSSTVETVAAASPAVVPTAATSVSAVAPSTTAPVDQTTATAGSVEDQVRSDVVAYQNLFYEVVTGLPGTDIQRVTDALAPKSFLQESTTNALKAMVSRGERARLNEAPVNVVKVGTVELLSADRARVELCASNNLVLVSIDGSGAEVVVSDVLDSRFTVEEWVLVDGTWKASVQRSSETQEGSVCDRLLAT